MSPISITIEGLVVGREEPAEGHRDFSLFSVTHGLLRCRRRLPAGKTSAVPDLFSEIEAVMNPMSGNHLFFLGEWRTTRSRPGIGSNYKRLEAAGVLARLVLLNARWLETFDCTSILMGKALDALDAEVPPEAVLLKALYLIVRSEGYPVDEDWRTSWKEPDQSGIKAFLGSSVKSCDVPCSDLSRWRRGLQRWIVTETDFSL